MAKPSRSTVQFVKLPRIEGVFHLCALPRNQIQKLFSRNNIHQIQKIAKERVFEVPWQLKQNSFCWNLWLGFVTAELPALPLLAGYQRTCTARRASAGVG